MTNEEKKEVLRKAISEIWSRMFGDFKWEASKENPDSFTWEKKIGPYEYTYYLAGCRDLWGNTIDLEYNPEEDIVGIYVKDRPIQEKFKDDIESLWRKYSPFDMELSFDDELAPTLSRKEKVEPNEFAEFLNGFRKAYDEYNFLFYMITICATEWYDGFYITASEHWPE